MISKERGIMKHIEFVDRREIEQEEGTPLGEGVDCVYLSISNEIADASAQLI
ncbi:MAG: hypothetical protein JRN15_23870 [Nitrososphaerota archaeon]|nr:hypothetical protein [Nitrososphaerota archaeon]